MESDTDATRAAALVESGDSVVVDSSDPRTVTAALARRDDVENVDVYVYGFPYGDRDHLAELARAPGIHLAVSMVPPDLRESVADGTVSYVPRGLDAASADPFPGEAGRRRVALLQATAEDASVCLGCTSTLADTAVPAADVVVAERNPRLPPARPGRPLRVGAVDCTVPVDRHPPVLSGGSPGQKHLAVAENLASILPEYPTLQIGVGTVALAVGEVLADRGPVDVWSGLVGESTRRLVEGGAARTVDGAVAVGEDADFYDWVRDREALRFGPPGRIHSQSALGGLSNFVAVNSALQVDLTGAVNAESIGGRILGGIGGQAAFMNAASRAPGGLAVVALTARTAGGHPKVVPSIGEEDAVTTPRSAVDVVVTEHGVADLRGRSAADRAAALVEVAHPDDRDRLQEWTSTGGTPPGK